MAVYVTGDCHRDFSKIEFFCRHNRSSLSKEDIMIVLGDAGINYALDGLDIKLKRNLAKLPITLLCVHGNHEERPYLMGTYVEVEWHGGSVYMENVYPNILFAKDGEIYDFDGKKAMAIGGAYSVDKEFRLMAGRPWFESEQPSNEIKAYVEERLAMNNWKVDYVLSHTCPSKWEPIDLFLEGLDQSKVDKSTEEWLTQLEKKMNYERWYFGHYHDNRTYHSAQMLFEEIRELGSDDFVQRLGRPKFRQGEAVMFFFNNGKEELELDGIIEIIDEYGTFFQRKEVSYDIWRVDDALYKHIPESSVFSLSNI